MRKITYLVVLFGLALAVLSSCTKDDDHDEENEITVQFISPENETTVVGDEVNIHVRLTATVSLYDVELILHPKNDDSNILLDIDQHQHGMERDLQETVDLSSFPGGTVFVLEVEASLSDDDHDDGEGDHNHNSDEKIVEAIEFTIQ